MSFPWPWPLSFQIHQHSKAQIDSSLRVVSCGNNSCCRSYDWIWFPLDMSRNYRIQSCSLHKLVHRTKRYRKVRTNTRDHNHHDHDHGRRMDQSNAQQPAHAPLQILPNLFRHRVATKHMPSLLPMPVLTVGGDGGVASLWRMTESRWSDDLL